MKSVLKRIILSLVLVLLLTGTGLARNFDGVQTVTAAGTAEALASARTMAFTVTAQAIETNTDAVFVGASTVDSTRGAYLLAGDSYTFPEHPNNVYDLREIFVDAAVNGEGVRFTYARR